MKSLLKIVFWALFGLMVFTCCAKGEERPNIILIMADDMGYSDLGCYGGEISTPSLDKLAEGGIRFSQFYNTARCCPTRASLMTGLFPHQTGVGQMTNSPKSEQYKSWGTEGYIGYLNQKCLTLAEVLKGAGYHTYMTGKWHLGYHDKARWPLQRGFEKFYGSIAGATSYFRPSGQRPVTLMNDHLPPPDSTSYYTTDAFTDYAIRFIDEQKDDRPFFLYLAYTAPHWPLHAKEEDIARFTGRYTHGWDEVRKERFRRQLEMGLFGVSAKLSERDRRVRPWQEVGEEQKILSDYRMAVYAAQVYCMDYNIGKLVEKLKKEGKYENTLILFLSDNGACAEMYHEFGSKPQSWINKANYSGAVSYGIGWANVSNTPFYEYKVRVNEGGIATPLIMHWPAGLKADKGSINHQRAYLIDIAPTLYELARADYPQTRAVHALEGNSLVPAMVGKKIDEHPYMYWEHQNNCAIRKGDWKAVKKLGDKKWQLYNLKNDRIESDNRAGEHSALVKELDEKWQYWAQEKKVLPKRQGIMMK